VDRDRAAGADCALLPLRFAPLLKTNIWLGALSGGAYIGFVFSAGAGAMEAYIERVSRNSGFEYGKARTFGSGMGAVRDHGRDAVQRQSRMGVLDGVGRRAAAGGAGGHRETAGQPDRTGDGLAGGQSFIGGFKTAVRMFRQRKMWMFILYVIGVACVYDVFDQQFATFFKSFFATPEAGTRAFGFATTAGEICNAIIMFSSPWIINRIGAKNTC
jgi:OHS family lactose permease-like MFS transporter